MTFLLFVALGFAVGIIGSAFGLGGGIFVVPVLVLYAHVPIHNAIAASLLTIIATSSAVASVNVERGLANVRLGLSLEVSTAVGAVCGAFAAGYLPQNILKLLFAFLLAFAGLTMLRKSFVKKPAQSDADAVPAHPLGSEFTDPATGKVHRYGVKHMPAASGISVFAGALSGLLGVGGGIVQVPLMNLICGVPMKAAAATSNFMLGVTAAASAAIYFRQGYVLPEMTLLLVLGVLAGSVLGMKLLAGVRSKYLEAVFGVIALLMAVQILRTAGYL